MCDEKTKAKRPEVAYKIMGAAGGDLFLSVAMYIFIFVLPSCPMSSLPIFVSIPVLHSVPKIVHQFRLGRLEQKRDTIQGRSPSDPTDRAKANEEPFVDTAQFLVQMTKEPVVVPGIDQV